MASKALLDDDGDLEALSFGDKATMHTVQLKVEGARALSLLPHPPPSLLALADAAHLISSSCAQA